MVITDTSQEKNNISLETKNLNAFYSDKEVLSDINIKIPENKIIGLMGPSGCGKSTFLRLFNRMNDFIDGFRLSNESEIFVDNLEISNLKNLNLLRRKVGMVFQKPNPFPMSIYDNVSYGLVVQGIKNKKILSEAVEEALKDAYIWNEVKDNLKKNALSLSGGQQQRICIARTLAVKPKILLMDEPTSALDPISTNKIEELMTELKGKITIVLVTHNIQQAARISDYAAFFYMGKMIEFGDTKIIFTAPKEKLTEEYITIRIKN